MVTKMMMVMVMMMITMLNQAVIRILRSKRLFPPGLFWWDEQHLSCAHRWRMQSTRTLRGGARPTEHDSGDPGAVVSPWVTHDKEAMLVVAVIVMVAVMVVSCIACFVLGTPTLVQQFVAAGV